MYLKAFDSIALMVPFTSRCSRLAPTNSSLRSLNLKLRCKRKRERTVPEMMNSIQAEGLVMSYHCTVLLSYDMHSRGEQETKKEKYEKKKKRPIAWFRCISDLI